MKRVILPSTRIRRGFCKGNVATDKNSLPCLSSARRAKNFCALGAIVRWSQDIGPESEEIYNLLTDAVDNAAYALCGHPIHTYNDLAKTTAQDVAAILHKAEVETGALKLTMAHNKKCRQPLDKRKQSVTVHA